MRNFLDTASIAQSLDGERLMGCLHYPGRNDIPRSIRLQAPRLFDGEAALLVPGLPCLGGR
jgi:hypothetical protein